jgi:rubrerythrin
MNSTAYYLSAWQRLPWDPDTLRTAAIEPPLEEMIEAAAFVESHSFEEGRKARLLGLTRHRETRQFLEVWLAEESEHGRALGHLARSHGLNPERFDGDGPGRAHRLAANSGLFLSRGSPLAASAALGIGAAAEYMTRAMYRVLGDRSRDPAIRELFNHLASQEGRHLGFFLGAAKATHAPVSSAQLKATQTILRRIWQPVGVDRLGIDRWLAVFGPLFRGLAFADFADQMSRMDGVLDRIPVMHGLGLMSRFRSRYQLQQVVTVSTQEDKDPGARILHCV